jgi:geranylgeranyl diphosphate synthase type II
MSVLDLPTYLETRRKEVDAALDRVLPPQDTPPPQIHAAMRYAVFAGGKRLRPILVLAGCEAAGGDPAAALELACAVEMVHTYSLVHDDLPALDDDDLRRGRPTVHRAFDEATAILTGDALLTSALEVAIGSDASTEVSAGASRSDLAGETAGATAMRRVAAARVLLAAIGTSGMIGGQVDDLLAGAGGAMAGGAQTQDAAHAGAADEGAGRVDEATVRSIHERKTGALLKACPVIGGILAGADPKTLARLGAYGSDLGLAFQIVDDILDIEGTSQDLGKSAGKDVAAGKATFPAAIGLARSRALAEELSARAVETVRGIGPSAAPLAALAEYAVRRRR